MKGIKAGETKEHVSKYETDKENPTVWILGTIDQLTRDKIDDMATSYEIDSEKPQGGKALAVFHFNRIKTDLVRVGLKGFRNFVHPETSKEIEFKTIATARFGSSHNVVSDQVLNMIPREVISELADEIDKMNKLSEEEVKNS